VTNSGKVAGSEVLSPLPLSSLACLTVLSLFHHCAGLPTLPHLPHFCWRACSSPLLPSSPPSYELTSPFRFRSQPKVLKNFSKTLLAAGAKSTITLNLSTYDLSIWDVVKQKWTLPSGKFTVSPLQSRRASSSPYPSSVTDLVLRFGRGMRR
jgi:hypothetical protein